MATTLSVATLLLTLFTFLPLWRNPHWLVRGLDFPRIQFTAMAILLLVALITVLDPRSTLGWILIALTLICISWQLWWILPYTLIWRRETVSAFSHDPHCQLSILTSNVLAPNHNAKALLALVHQHKPDVLVTLESNQWWQDQLDALAPDMPYSIKCPLDNLYGMHVYSRLPLEETEIKYLIEDDVPSMHALIRLRNDVRVQLHFLHPAPPSPTENPESAERDAEMVLVARSIAESDMPVIVTGDLNDVAWSATTRLFRKISGLLDPRVGRGLFNTYNANYPFLRWPLDHLFHSHHFTLCSIERLHSIGSDHFPLFAVLSFEPKKETNNAGLEADNDDNAWAHAIVQKQAASPGDVPTPGD